VVLFVALSLMKDEVADLEVPFVHVLVVVPLELLLVPW